MKRKETKKILTHHLYFCMRDFGHHIGEDTEIYFSLFDSKNTKYVRYVLQSNFMRHEMQSNLINPLFFL